MSNATSTAVSAALTSGEIMRISTHNMANGSSMGFKKQDALVADNGYTTGAKIGSGTPTSLYQHGYGSRVVGTSSDFSQGSLENTYGNRMNIAIDGEGFLVITMPDGTLGFTRAGALSVNNEGVLVMASTGYQIGQQPITLPEAAAKDFSIEQDGNVTANVNGVIQNLGRIEMAVFFNKSGLERMGDGIFVATAASSEPVFSYPRDPNIGSIKQGFLEKSNVDPIIELLKLTDAARDYAMALRAFEMLNDAQKRATQGG